LLGPQDRPSRREVRRQRRAAEGRRDHSVGVLMIATAFLVAAGLIMVLSASSVSAFEETGSSFTFFKRQLIYAVLGSLAMLVTSRMRLQAWQRLALPFTAVSAVFLVLVLLPGVGTIAGGSARWIAIGGFTVQPSEMTKLAVVALTATVLARKWKLLNDPVQVALPLLPIVAVVCGLVLLQPDLGTTIVLAATVFLMLFAAGVRLRHLAVAGGMSLVLGSVLIMSSEYRRVRFLAFLHPFEDSLNKGFQIVQSLIGLASGSWLGVGLGASRQKWSYVPNAHTDFIFSIIGEELGFLGNLLLLLAFGAFLFAGVRIAIRAKDRFARLFAAGIVAWLGFQTLLNLGAVTGVLPITGVPLPFVSFGGSSLVICLAAVGVLVHIGREGARAERARR
jgi:cell division protein FtsW